MPYLFLNNDKSYRIYCALESSTYHRLLEQNVQVETSEKIYAKRRLERVYTDKKL